MLHTLVITVRLANTFEQHSIGHLLILSYNSLQARGRWEKPEKIEEE